jgi:hypothetical protein
VSQKQTAKLALEILSSGKNGFRVLTETQRKNLMLAFAEKGKVLYGNAYDLVKCPENVDFYKIEEIRKALKSIIVYEVKSTNRTNVKGDFSGYFFALTTAELLVSQSLKAQYKFAFVNTITGKHIEMTTRQILARARNIYPTWSITL